MTYYIKNGNTYRPTDESNVDIRTSLPVGNYVIKADQFGNLFFEVIDSFSFSSKRYGNNPRHTQRILDTFMSRENATGVMLVGEKGSGKSLLAKTVSIEAAKIDVPTIIINYPLHGESFNTFIQSIEQPAVVIFDEFEKVYDEEGQEAILTLLDGVFPTKKLFVITSNDKWRIDRHMRNRPGRIFYMLEFKGLDNNFIVEYCNDNLNNKSHIEKICTIATMFNQFNFDMLKALVEEMNRYNESPEQALEWLNAKPEFEENSNYDLDVFVSGVKVKANRTTWSGNPLNRNIEIGFHLYKDTPQIQLSGKSSGKIDSIHGNDDEAYPSEVTMYRGESVRGRLKSAVGVPEKEEEEEEELGYCELTVNYTNLVKIDSTDGKFIFADGNVTVHLTRQKVTHFKYGDLF